MSATGFKGRIILLNGLHGVGKTTIAKAVQSELYNESSRSPTPDHNSSVRLVDQTLWIDIADNLIPRQVPKNLILQRGIRDRASAALREELKLLPGLHVIMTSCAEDVRGLSLSEQVEFAKACNLPLFLVDVVCERAEHYRRYHAPERLLRAHGKGREALAWENLDANVRHDKHCVRLKGSVLESTLEGITILHGKLDSTGMSAEKSGAEIVKWVRDKSSKVLEVSFLDGKRG